MIPDKMPYSDAMWHKNAVLPVIFSKGKNVRREPSWIHKIRLEDFADVSTDYRWTKGIDV